MKDPRNELCPDCRTRFARVPAWTERQPTEPGIYWIFRVEGPRLPHQRPLLIDLADVDGKLWLIADWGEYPLDQNDGGGFVWMGPLAVPAAPEPRT